MNFVIVPLAIASLLTGVVQALATPWGLFRHYWVVIKLFLTVFATLVLLASPPRCHPQPSRLPMRPVRCPTSEP